MIARAQADHSSLGPSPTPQAAPQYVAVGGLLAFNSTIGKAAKAALELAVADVNNAGILESSQLVLHLGNTNCSAFQGAAAGAFRNLINHLPLANVDVAHPQSMLLGPHRHYANQ